MLGGGGIIGVIILVLVGLLAAGGGSGGVDAGELLQGGPQTTGVQGGADLAAECRTGADANRREDCRIVGVVNSVQSYWNDAFADSNLQYRAARTRLFSGTTMSGCGPASSETGPFYCPADQTVYMDLSFFDTLSLPPFNAQGGPFAQAYVVAHEYGHHVQTLLGQSAGNDRQGPATLGLRAPGAAGRLLRRRVGRQRGGDAATSRSSPRRTSPTGLDAAAAVGDDRIQENTRGRVDPESFTHGTSAQRQRWFMRGYESGDPDACDTFRGSI